MKRTIVNLAVSVIGLILLGGCGGGGGGGSAGFDCTKADPPSWTQRQIKVSSEEDVKKAVSAGVVIDRIVNGYEEVVPVNSFRLRSLEKKDPILHLFSTLSRLDWLVDPSDSEGKISLRVKEESQGGAAASWEYSCGQGGTLQSVANSDGTSYKLVFENCKEDESLIEWLLKTLEEGGSDQPPSNLESTGDYLSFNGQIEESVVKEGESREASIRFSDFDVTYNDDGNMHFAANFAIALQTIGELEDSDYFRAQITADGCVKAKGDIPDEVSIDARLDMIDLEMFTEVNATEGTVDDILAGTGNLKLDGYFGFQGVVTLTEENSKETILLDPYQFYAKNLEMTLDYSQDRTDLNITGGFGSRCMDGWAEYNAALGPDWSDNEDGWFPYEGNIVINGGEGEVTFEDGVATISVNGTESQQSYSSWKELSDENCSNIYESFFDGIEYILDGVL